MARFLIAFRRRLRYGNVNIFIPIILSIIAILALIKTIRNHENWQRSHIVLNIQPTTGMRTIANQKPTKRLDVILTTRPFTQSLTTQLDVCEIPAEKTSLGSSASLARRFPHIIIIGFGKAGTRALYQMIRMHPDIVGSPSEIRFFSNNGNYELGLPFYFGQLPSTKASQKTIVKSPDYIISPVAAARLKKALSHCHRSSKDIKFIVVLRDPFTRAVSEYLQWNLHLFKTSRKPLPPFEKLCVKKSGEINNLYNQLNGSIYSYHLKNWLKHFNMKQICFVNGENLVKDPYSELKKLEKCLELRSFIQPHNFYFNKMKGYYCPVDTQGNPRCLAPSKGRRHPKINETVERKLRKFYEPFNKILYNITGVDYRWT